MEALIQHFLIYSQGFTGADGGVLVPSKDREASTVCMRCPMARTGHGGSRCAPSFLAIQALPTLHQGGPHR